LTLPDQWKAAIKHYIDKWEWLYTDKTLFTKTGTGQIQPMKYSLLIPVTDQYDSCESWFWESELLGLNPSSDTI
jgi:hypothetical protein